MHNNKAFLSACILLSFIFLNKELTAQGPGRNAPIVLAADDTAAFAHAPVGFDKRKENVLHGKTDSVEYDSRTVGTKRKLLIYTPPGYSSNKNIRYSIFYMALVAMKKSGTNMLNPM